MTSIWMYNNIIMGEILEKSGQQLLIVFPFSEAVGCAKRSHQDNGKIKEKEKEKKKKKEWIRCLQQTKNLTTASLQGWIKLDTL